MLIVGGTQMNFTREVSLMFGVIYMALYKMGKPMYLSCANVGPIRNHLFLIIMYIKKYNHRRRAFVLTFEETLYVYDVLDKMYNKEYPKTEDVLKAMDIVYQSLNL